MRHNPDVCKELLEILLEFKIERIEMSQEEVVDIDFASKGIRMDVYVKDGDGLKAYNIEIQTTDTEELPERARKRRAKNESPAGQSAGSPCCPARPRAGITSPCSFQRRGNEHKTLVKQTNIPYNMYWHPRLGRPAPKT